MIQANMMHTMLLPFQKHTMDLSKDSSTMKQPRFFHQLVRIQSNILRLFLLFILVNIISEQQPAPLVPKQVLKERLSEFGAYVQACLPKYVQLVQGIALIFYENRISIKFETF